MYETLEYDAHDGIATISLDRPDVYNAVTADLLLDLNAAIRRARTDSGTDVIILTGNGDGFCAGMDYTEMPSWADLSKAEYASFLRNAQNVVRQLRAGVPTIAAVNGPAIGGGCGFAVACTARFMGPQAFLRQNYPEIGLVPVDGSGWLLPRLIGEARTLDFFLTGKDITPDQAVDLGLANAAVDDPLAASHEYAATLLRQPARAVENTIKLVTHSRSFDEYCSQAIDEQWARIQDPEHHEAVAAFKADRDPIFDREYSLPSTDPDPP